MPITGLAFYQQPEVVRVFGAASVEPPLVPFIRNLRAAWEKSIPAAPHVGGSNDPEQDLLHILGMDASSTVFRGRSVVGDGFLYNWLALLGVPGLLVFVTVAVRVTGLPVVAGFGVATTLVVVAVPLDSVKLTHQPVIEAVIGLPRMSEKSFHIPLGLAPTN